VKETMTPKTKNTASNHSPLTIHQSPQPLHDVQQLRDTRKIAIDRVGVKDISYPIVVMDKANRVQQTVARISMSVDLPHHFKGTHMSRFIEILNTYRENIALEQMEPMLATMKEKLGASRAHLEMSFPYFIEKRAPVSGARSLMEYSCSFSATLGDDLDFVLGVTVPLTSLCPCSRELSAYGAHNQRSHMTVRVRYREFLWIEDLVALAEECGSSPVWSLLKRQDEKHVTERAYDNPRFVEDMVREATLRLQAEPRITWFAVEAENFESIHNHSAYAAIERDRRPPPSPTLG
jgi:GTP cyclohydrolase I